MCRGVQNKAETTVTFVRGKSGNPGGRPKAALDVQALARQHTPAAIAALVAALKNERERVPAAQALLDRAWGKPLQPTDVTTNGEAVRYVMMAVPEAESTEAWLEQYAPKGLPGRSQ